MINSPQAGLQTITPKMFGAVGDGISDDTSAINNAIEFIRDNGGGILYVDKGTYLVSTINLFANISIKGSGLGATVFKANSANPVFAAIGVLNQSSHPLQNIVLEDLSVNGDYIGQGFLAQAASFIRINRCKFSSFDDYGIKFVEVWDCTIASSFIANITNENASGLVFLSSDGSNDNTNQILFSCCDFETYASPAIYFDGKSGATQTVNEISFSQCKFESVYSGVNHIEGNYTSSISFSQCTFTISRDSDGSITRAINISNSRGLNVVNCITEFFGDGDVLTPPFNLINHNNAKFDSVVVRDFENLLTVGLTQTGSSNINWALCSVGNSFIYPFGPSSANNSQSRFYGQLPIYNTSESEPSVMFQRFDSLGGYKFHLGRVTSDDKFRLMRDETPIFQVENNLDISIVTGQLKVSTAWNSPNLLRVGTSRIWVDGGGKLRIKTGSNPTSDTDGTIVGTQS